MSQDDVERVARAICIDHTIDLRRAQDFARTAVTAYLSEMPPRLSPELIAKLNALASRLTQMGEYDACDLIDTVVERVSAMPQRELLAEWKPINTAPLDGKRILAWRKTWYMVNTCHWSDNTNCWIRANVKLDRPESWPTHWMPLPDPPNRAS